MADKRICKGIKTNGDPCTRPAKHAGFCGFHRPKRAKRGAAKVSSPGESLAESLSRVVRAMVAHELRGLLGGRDQ